MKRATFYKIALSSALVGIAVAVGLLSAWKFSGMANTDVWTWLYPASLMLMAADGVSVGAQVVIVVLSIATNAGLYFIAASAICGLVAGFRQGLHD